ncbi:MAG: Uma2 family endonuclease [Cyanomargarita calcarea GSE-NOS-MK-12-04C]|jgi:Uma2 family endonuclease|uniref:Uma2 family endonuclease n=1 Tax=Cyanomargarita calcarea GSE-NOS-MK-12-04C TaxID=2839659 RepID=A0A951QM20_9CYAN|nr:Uma2 family endonuclease [Cyanomargarita calcarea GSE-NOS-MK-12-04C]
MSQTPLKMTVEEYLTYDDGTDKRYELENGVLIEMPPGTGKHEAIITFLVVRFFLEKERLGLTLEPRSNGVEVMTSKQIRRPDVLVMTTQQAISIENKSAILRTAPPLIVEIVSPESVDRDYNIKTLEYAAFGVNEYWIVDPLDNKVTVCLLPGSVYNQAVFTGNEQIVSLIFPQINLTAQQVLASKL